MYHKHDFILRLYERQIMVGIYNQLVVFSGKLFVDNIFWISVDSWYKAWRDARTLVVVCVVAANSVPEVTYVSRQNIA